MKFGRFHGVVLIVLGLVFLAGQAMISFGSRARPPRGDSPPASAIVDKPAIPPVFGIMAALSLVAGVILLGVSPKKSLDQEVRDSRRRP